MKGESECDCVKKIGILTFHKSINYGSVLQAFALSDLLSKRGYAVEIIDYEPASYSIQYRIFEKNTSVHNVAANIRRLSVFDILWEQKKGFEKFREEYLPLSACKFTQASSPQEFSKYYDAVICGSDQIWNVTAKDCDPIFFLPGKQSYKKIAYAASVNTATYNEDVCDDQLRKNILDFDYISIREHSGAKKISHFLNTDKQVKVQPDPSLLQTKEVFAAIASKRIVEKPYIFMYCANYQESTIRTAQKVSKLLKKPVYTVPVCRSATQIAKLKESGIRIIRDKNRPEDFLSFVMNSDLVLSDSFHGTAFSIIFEKKFFSVNDYINGEYVDDERIRNILGELGIPERYIKEEDIQNLDFQKEIDYTVVTGKRLELAENAIKDITKAIED
jgi:hypothetical protein